MNLTASSRALELQGAGNGVASGIISNSANTLNVAKDNGAGTWTLAGVNTYTGPTTLNAGNLTISATGSTVAASAVTVNNTNLPGTASVLTVNGTAAGTVAVTGSGITTSATTNNQLRGTGTVGAVTVSDATNKTAAVWPGLAISVLGLTTNETLTATSANFSSGGKLALVLSSNGGSGGTGGVNQKLVAKSATPTVTIDGSSVLSIAADNSSSLNGAAPSGQYVIVETRNAANALLAGIATAFTPANIKSGSLVPGTDFNVIYKDATGAVIATDPSGGTLASSAAQIVLQFNATSVTPVTVGAFSANASGMGVRVSWNSISEYQNAGFNIYRRVLNGGEWTKVNPALIAGRITNPDPKTYGLYDWASAGIYEYKLESVSVRGVVETHSAFAGPVTLDSTLSLDSVSQADIDAAAFSVDAARNSMRTHDLSAKFAQAAAASNATPEVGASSLGSLNTSSLPPALARHADGTLLQPATVTVLDRNSANTQADARALAVSARSASIAPASTNLAAAARWFSADPVSPASAFTGVKVVYNTPGVLLIPQASLPAGYNIRHVSMQREGRTLLPLALTADGLIVFGQGYQDDYSDTDALFLRAIAGQTAAGQITYAQRLFAGAQTVNTDTPATVSVEYHDVYFDFNLRPYTFPPWFSSEYLSADAATGTTQSFSVETPSASSGAGLLTVNLWSLTQSDSVAPDHALQVLVNGQPVGQAVWTGGNKMLQLAFQVPSGVLNAGSNQVELVTPAIPGVDSQISFLHSMTVAYTQQLDGSHPVTVTNAGSASGIYELNHLPDANAWVVDARYPDLAALVPFETQAQDDGTFKLRFTAGTGGTGQYLVVPAGQENTPLAVTTRQVKPIKAASGVYWAVGPSQFGAGVQPLLAQRTKEGIRGSFVDQEQLFDYYNYGRYGPDGIRNAVLSVRPQYLLLLGRTTYDYHDYSGLNVDPLCPAFLVSTTFWAQSTSDSSFGDLGRGYPEVAVGRLPANNPGELSNAVQHVLSYPGAPSSGVRVHAVADQADPDVADFPAQTAALAQSMPDLSWQANYLGVTYQTAGEVTAAMTTAANGGADWLIYVGHGNASRLGRTVPRILDVDGVQAWTGSAVFLQSTCTANWSAANEVEFKSIAIQALTQPQGGISASIASSTYMNSDCAVAFMAQLLKNADKTGMRWGNALMMTQQWAQAKGAGFYSDLNKTEQIFGDPAMPVFMKGAPAKTTPGAGTTGAGNSGSTPVSGTF